MISSSLKGSRYRPHSFTPKSTKFSSKKTTTSAQDSKEGGNFVFQGKNSRKAYKSLPTPPIYMPRQQNYMLSRQKILIPRAHRAYKSTYTCCFIRPIFPKKRPKALVCLQKYHKGHIIQASPRTFICPDGKIDQPDNEIDLRDDECNQPNDEIDHRANEIGRP